MSTLPALHICSPEPFAFRARYYCPYHKHLCYGTVTMYEWYGPRLEWDCGTMLSPELGYWWGPPDGPRGGKGQWHHVSGKVWDKVKRVFHSRGAGTVIKGLSMKGSRE